jgi:APA family basic amino acid/polyamine antiporter
MRDPKKLNLFDSAMLIMGSMIGSGIFIVSAQMGRELSSPMYLILAWVLTAVFTIFAALSYGELAASMPKAGGQYVYLKEAYGDLFGFLYGWTFFTVIQTGTIAAVAIAFAKFTGVLTGLVSDELIIVGFGVFSISSQQLLAIFLIVSLTVFNFLPVKSGAILQNVFTVSKIGALLFLLMAGLWYIITNNLPKVSWVQNNADLPDISLSVFAAALVGSIFSSDAWNNITFTAGEIQNPKKNLPLSLLIGTGVVSLLYVLVNLIYVYALPFSAIQQAQNDRVGTLLLQQIFGSYGSIIMAVLIMVSTFGCVNGLVLSGARVYYAMALDKLFFKQTIKLNKNQSPAIALTMQGFWASLLVLSGSYSNLLDYVVFAVLLFYILTVAAVFVLRKKQPDLARPYKVIGYPVLPVVYILMAVIIAISLLIQKPLFTYRGLLVVLSGIPIYYVFKKRLK